MKIASKIIVNDLFGTLGTGVCKSAEKNVSDHGTLGTGLSDSRACARYVPLTSIPVIINLNECAEPVPSVPNPPPSPTSSNCELDERIAIMMFDGGLDETTASRLARAAYYQAMAAGKSEELRAAVNNVVRHFVLVGAAP
jgi:hypothetical protein